MTALKLLLVAVVLAILPQGARAVSRKSGPDPSNVAIFCPGPYALCIKAACAPETDAKGKVTNVVCSCVVEHGWSMGPASCEARVPVVHNGQMQLMSTYSNSFNTPDHQNLSCKGSSQPWANCYGATCTVDPADPSRARCKCPVRYGDMVTLGGDCNKNNCGKMWSTARPAENAFANTHYWKFMTDHGFPTNPPAKACGTI